MIVLVGSSASASDFDNICSSHWIISDGVISGSGSVELMTPIFNLLGHEGPYDSDDVKT